MTSILLAANILLAYLLIYGGDQRERLIWLHDNTHSSDNLACHLLYYVLNIYEFAI